MRLRARFLAVPLLLAGCAGGAGRVGAADLSYGDYKATGLASWYGEELAGNRTASGERFDPEGITAAHRSLPLGSIVEVTALDTGKSILVRVNDRGPGRKDRLIDLSRGAARLLGTERNPVAQVRVRAITPGTMLASTSSPVVKASSGLVAPASLPMGKGPFVIQIATFSNKDRASALAGALDGEVVSRRGLWRVRIGPYDNAAKAQRARDAVAARGYGDAQILDED